MHYGKCSKLLDNLILFIIYVDHAWLSIYKYFQKRKTKQNVSSATLCMRTISVSSLDFVT